MEFAQNLIWWLALVQNSIGIFVTSGSVESIAEYQLMVYCVYQVKIVPSVCVERKCHDYSGFSSVGQKIYRTFLNPLGKCVHVHAMIPYGGVNLQPLLCLTCTLSRGEWSFSRFGRFRLEESIPVLIAGRLFEGVPQFRTGRYGQEMILLFLPETESRPVCSLAAVSTSLCCLRFRLADFPNPLFRCLSRSLLHSFQSG